MGVVTTQKKFCRGVVTIPFGRWKLNQELIVIVLELIKKPVSSPEFPKGQLLAKNGIFSRGKGMRFKEPTFWVQKVHFLGPTPLPSILSTGLN